MCCIAPLAALGPNGSASPPALCWAEAPGLRNLRLRHRGARSLCRHVVAPVSPAGIRAALCRSHGPLGHFSLVRGEGIQDLALLTVRNAEVVERPCQLGGDLVEFVGGDV